jgi:hypothetical protein
MFDGFYFIVHIKVGSKYCLGWWQHAALYLLMLVGWRSVVVTKQTTVCDQQVKESRVTGMCGRC